MISVLLLACLTNDSKTDSAIDIGDPNDTVDSSDTVDLNETECGNGILEEGERCDDGNDDNFDACAFDCTVKNQLATYTQHNRILRNPERGFYRQVSFVVGNEQPEDISQDLLQFADENISLVLLMFDLRAFVSTDLSTEALIDIETYFQQVRDAGLKAIVRFRYTNEDISPLDATPTQTIAHIEQLTPLLEAQSDIIFVFQAGFIGKHGEWYASDHWGQPDGHPTDAWTTDDDGVENRRSLVEKMLAAVDHNRTVQLRTPYYRTIMFGDAHACHDGSELSRIGHFNDCFLASDNDVGTYRNDADKEWLIDDSPCTGIGGETCRVFAPRSQCESALSEMETLHWTYLNAGYNTDVLDSWSDVVEDILIPKEAIWKYNDSGSDLGTNWKEVDFNDQEWDSGQAELGYGDNDENTEVSYGDDASQKHITTYFRHHFEVDTIPSDASLRIELKMDDGAAVYLNGTEIVRSNLPEGAMYNTPAGTDTVSESAFFSFDVDPNLLVLGSNLLAVEVHQISVSSSDISFDASVHLTRVDESTGCMSEVQRRLGYRFALTDSILPQEASAGSSIGVDLNVQNIGFAAPINPRDIRLELESVATEQRWAILLDSDPRLWVPQDEAWNIRQVIGLPLDIPSGEYRWLLTLPDPTPTLQGSSGYSIQLSNETIWDSDRQLHDLGQPLVINAESAASLYGGDNNFEAVE
ncbi:MAG: DUF4832 domain-containing protein [Myxococcota bacterium]